MPSQPSPTRVLVVDDDEMSRELLTVLLEGEGYAVQSAESGEAALALIENGSIADLVLTDMQLPGISGADLARRLRSACSASALLLAISGSQPSAETATHFDGFLLKPFPMEEVAAALQAHSHRAVSEAAPGKSQIEKSSAMATSRTPSPRAPRRRRTINVTGRASEATSPAPQNPSKKRMTVQIHEEPIAYAGETTGTSGGTTALPVLNEKIFQQLAGCMPGPQLQEMYTLCVDDARQRIAGMRRLAAVHDGAMFIREAHAIKGGSGMLGATELHRRAAELETRGLAKGPRGETQDVNSLDELSAACDRLERMLGSRL